MRYSQKNIKLDKRIFYVVYVYTIIRTRDLLNDSQVEARLSQL